MTLIYLCVCIIHIHTHTHIHVYVFCECVYVCTYCREWLFDQFNIMRGISNFYVQTVPGCNTILKLIVKYHLCVH